MSRSISVADPDRIPTRPKVSADAETFFVVAVIRVVIPEYSGPVHLDRDRRTAATRSVYVDRRLVIQNQRSPRGLAVQMELGLQIALVRVQHSQAAAIARIVVTPIQRHVHVRSRCPFGKIGPMFAGGGQGTSGGRRGGKGDQTQDCANSTSSGHDKYSHVW